MTVKEIEAKAAALKELQALIEEAQAEAEAIKNELKAELGEKETVQAGLFKITYKEIISTRIDTAALKKAMPEVAGAFTKTTSARRFCVA